MKIVADEGIERPVVLELRMEGYQVIYIAEVASGITDFQVLEIAYQERALLLTLDKDFGDLVFYRRYKTYGVMLLRLPERFSSKEKARSIVDVIKNYREELHFSFTVISAHKIRIARIFPNQEMGEENEHR